MTSQPHSSEGYQVLLIVGPFPPPPGGVAIHIQRLADLCTDAGIQVQIVSPYGKREGEDPPLLRRLSGSGWRRVITLFRLIQDSPATVIHLHASAFGRLVWITPLLLRAVGNRHLIISIHSGSWPPADGSAFVGLRGRLLTRLLKACDTVIAVNERQADALKGLSRSVLVVPAYLPAPHPARMPTALSQAITTARAQGRLIAVTSGNGTPHYRYQDVVDAVELDGPDRWLVVIATYRRFDEQYLSKIAQRCTDVEVVMVRDLSPADFQSVLAAADVYVRATDRDGDAVTIREALALGKPVIASDASVRPPAAVIYPVGQAAQLAKPLRSIEESTAPDRQVLESNSGWHNLKAVYQRFGLSQPPDPREGTGE